jgi:hypothetical protein
LKKGVGMGAKNEGLTDGRRQRALKVTPRGVSLTDMGHLHGGYCVGPTMRCNEDRPNSTYQWGWAYSMRARSSDGHLVLLRPC